jgi:hypothetical protein
VKVTVDPPVDEGVRRTLVTILRDYAAPVVGSAGYREAWRRAGLGEGVARDEAEPSYALSPRSTRGATRA